MAEVKGRGRGDRQKRKLSRRLAILQRTLKKLPGAEAFHAEFEAKRALLEAMDYIDENGQPTGTRHVCGVHQRQRTVDHRAVFQRRFCTIGPEDDLNALATTIDYEPRKGETRPSRHAFDIRPVFKAIQLIREMELAFLGYSELEFNDHVARAAQAGAAARVSPTCSAWRSSTKEMFTLSDVASTCCAKCATPRERMPRWRRSSAIASPGWIETKFPFCCSRTNGVRRVVASWVTYGSIKQ